MPELPEVETTLRGIVPHVANQVITKVIVRQFQLRWPIPVNLPSLLLGKRFLQLERRAKYLILKSNQGCLLIHLGMSGHLRILTNFQLPNKHDHVDIEFHNKKILRFNDPRRFGAILWLEGNPDEHPLLKHLGVEPLTRQFNAKYLHARAMGRNVPIKSFLMDNKIVTGIGNIYATEALFAAGIHPLSPAKSLAISQLEKLVTSSKEILRRAIKNGGTTLKDFVDSHGKPGYFSSQLKVYGRAGESCVNCNSILEFLRIGQRSTVYCSRCQR